MMIGTDRTRISATMKKIIIIGREATALRSILAPEATKNSGMKKPWAIPSSFVSRTSFPSGTIYLRMNPAAKAPSTMSIWNMDEKVTSMTSMSTVIRTKVWDVDSDLLTRNR